MASARRIGVRKSHYLFWCLKHGECWVTRQLSPYTVVWARWLQRVRPGDGKVLVSVAFLERGMERLLKKLPRAEVWWHAWRHAGTAYLRASGLPWCFLVPSLSVCLVPSLPVPSSQSELHDLSCFGAVCSYPLGKHGECWVTRQLRPYKVVWARWLQRVRPGDEKVLVSVAFLERGMERLLKKLPRAEVWWHAWRHAGTAYLRASGLPWCFLCRWGRWASFEMRWLFLRCALRRAVWETCLICGAF